MDATERLAKAVERLTEVIERLSIQHSAFSNQDSPTDVRAGAARGSEPIGTAVANDSTVDRIVTSTEENSRSCVRSSRSRTHERTGISWEELTTHEIDESDVTTDAISFRAKQIAQVVRCKRGKHWRDDRRLVVVAAVLAERIDAVSADGQAGTRWLNRALDSVREYRPENSAAYFQRCIKDGLGDLDPVMRDRATADLLWIRLTRVIHVPEKWLAEPPAQRVSEAG